MAHNLNNQMDTEQSHDQRYTGLHHELKKEISSDQFDAKYHKLDDRIGAGGSSEVFLGMVNDSDTKVAIKITPVQRGNCVYPRVVAELKILRSLQHPNILKYLDGYLIENDLWLVTEYIEGVTLSVMSFQTDLLRPQTPMCPPSPAFVAICRQILEALVYLHSQNIIHRDIKSKNIVLRRDGCVKVIDFGLSSWTDRKHVTPLGTPGWMAPEIIRFRYYDCKADIWSFGITMLEMLDARLPHAAFPDVSGQIDRCGRPQLPQVYPLLYYVLDKCLKEESKERAKAEELLSLPLFKASDDLKLKQVQALQDTVQAVMKST